MKVLNLRTEKNTKSSCMGQQTPAVVTAHGVLFKIEDYLFFQQLS